MVNKKSRAIRSCFYFKNVFMNFNLIVLFLFSAGSLFATPKSTDNNPKPVRWLVEKSSKLKVNGSSNINEYSCDITGYYRPDTIYCFNDGRQKQVALSGCLEIDVLAFNCHNQVITKDLRKTLKANKYPYLNIKFLSLDHLPANGRNEAVNVKVEVQLAGVSKVLDLPFQFTRQGNGFVLNGSKSFCFSDFNLQAPDKFGGMIKVKDVFSVDFSLNMNVIP
jgi:hypothetical protein